ncbi:hypothetical protein D6777_03715 [Candidatus Woesearchaeota archaeon]|nr:MAG: hypothetical protein D6777_03715 [Candidatus Woesearchaeota archaeon]
MANKNYFIIVLVTIFLISSGCQQKIEQNSSDFVASANIKELNFKSVEQLRSFLQDNQGTDVRSNNLAIAKSSITGTSLSQLSKSTSYSGTNVQVLGVDEGDIVKTDGEYIYTITENTVFIIKAYPGEDAKIVGKIIIQGMPKGLFVNKDKLVVYGDVTKLDDFKVIDFTPRDGLTFFRIYNIEDKSTPKLIKDYSFEGRYFQSRMIDNYVYFIVTSNPDYRRPVPVPIYYDSGKRKEIKVNDIHYFNIPYDTTQFVTIHAINVDTNSLNSKTLVVEGSQNLYMSEKNIFLTYTKYINEWKIRQDIMLRFIEPKLTESDKAYIEKIRNVDEDILSKWEKRNKIMNVIYSYLNYLPTNERDEIEDKVESELKEKMKEFEAREYTVIHRVSISDGQIDVQANGKVPGRIINQFSLDEKDNVLRLATTISPSFFILRRDSENVQRESSNHVFTLDTNLNILDRLDGLAKGESIYSTRFIGDRLYMVTFKQVDPFFVIDLSDPRDIKLLGKLKIPGFSRYLHPYDDNMIIGIGRDTTEEGRTKGLKISLFDVSDFNNPKEVAKFVSKDRYAQSLAEYEHKAFLFSKDKHLLVIPAYSFDWKDNNGYNGAMVFYINKDKIELRGLIDHSKGLSSRLYSPAVERSLYINELLYTKSPSLLRINALKDLSSVNEIALTPDNKADIPIF